MAFVYASLKVSAVPPSKYAWPSQIASSAFHVVSFRLKPVTFTAANG